MLYDRDYRKLTEEEIKLWEKVERRFEKDKKEGVISTNALYRYYQDLPDAVLYYKQLFPNHYIQIESLRKNATFEPYIEQVLNNFLTAVRVQKDKS